LSSSLIYFIVTSIKSYEGLQTFENLIPEHPILRAPAPDRLEQLDIQIYWSHDIVGHRVNRKATGKHAFKLFQK